MLNAIMAIGTLCTMSSSSIVDSAEAQAKCKAYYAECIGSLYAGRSEFDVAEKLRQCMIQRETRFKWEK